MMMMMVMMMMVMMMMVMMMVMTRAMMMMIMMLMVIMMVVVVMMVKMMMIMMMVVMMMMLTMMMMMMVQNLVGIDAEELRQAFHDNAEGLFQEMRIGDERSQGDEVNETNQTPPIARTFSPLQKQMLECVLKEEFRSRVSAVAGLGSFGHSHVCRCRGTA